MFDITRDPEPCVVCSFADADICPDCGWIPNWTRWTAEQWGAYRVAKHEAWQRQHFAARFPGADFDAVKP